MKAWNSACKTFSRNVCRTDGFSLIEVIGVLAVIGILAALIMPRVMDVIADSKVNALAAALKTYETAVVAYYADIGSVLPLDSAGAPAAETTGDSATATALPARLTLSSNDALVLTTGLWPSFKGPYLEEFITSSPPGLGTSIYMPTNSPVSYGSATTSTNLGWDLNGDGNSDIPTNAKVVYIKLNGLTDGEFLDLDRVLDPHVGTDEATRRLRGRAKYDTASTTLYLYLAHR